MSRILIIKPSSLGDVANTLPLLCDLRAALPDARIDWLIHPAFVPLIQGHDALSNILLFDRKRLGPWWYKPSAFTLFHGLLHTLRANRYDAVIDGQGLLRTGFLTRITGAKMRIGWAHGGEGSTLAYTHKIHFPHKGRRTLSVDRMRGLGRPLGTNPDAPAQFHLPLQPAAVLAAQQFLETSAIRHSAFVAVCPGARWNTKRWPIDRYTQLVGHLLDSGHNVVLLGSPDEKPLCDQIHSQLETRNSKLETFLNLAGRTDLATMIALLARARLIIGHDSGPIHLAAALDQPVVALYGPTAIDYAAPYGRIDQVLRHDVPCYPCRRRECDHHSCMNGLSVELVWERTARQLDQPASKPADLETK